MLEFSSCNFLCKTQKRRLQHFELDGRNHSHNLICSLILLECNIDLIPSFLNMYFI